MSNETEFDPAGVSPDYEGEDDQTVILAGPSARARHEIVRRIARKTRRVTLNGKQANLSQLALFVRAIKNRALTGDVRYCRLQERLRNLLELEESGMPKAVLISGERLDYDEWELRHGLNAVSHEEFVRIMEVKWAPRKAAWEAQQEAKRNQPPSTRRTR
ncbi:hypothetical protein [Sphingomonas prati]|uniref:Uncharacterized protein n=1 Tax=Sphingomonas prati TaxID=1843237 RepID=A0A7W9F465_9SPHN|nr:hypothetical protein [Sphingomonas prati]MBB5730594.1 hypothetical protein [Sphingomonas prati]GGE95211.1 hypothetical protein GCM10011404_30440 [Sphingomonas prati]